MNRSTTDNSIIARLNRGDVQALEQVFNEYHKGLCFFAANITGNKEEAEDIVTELFINLWKKNTVFENLPNLKAFLYMSVRNACFDWLKHKKRRIAPEKELAYLLTDQHEEISFQGLAAEAEVLQFIYSEIEQLPPECRIIFKLLIQGQSTEAIAGQLKKSKRNILNQKARAIKLLRIALLGRGLLLVVYGSWFIVHGS